MLSTSLSLITNLDSPADIQVNDTNSNTIVRLLVGEDEYKGETTVEKSVVRGTTIHERLYEINTTIMVVKVSVAPLILITQ